MKKVSILRGCDHHQLRILLLWMRVIYSHSNGIYISGINSIIISSSGINSINSINSSSIISSISSIISSIGINSINGSSIKSNIR